MIVREIRVEGLQRISEATVYHSLPLNIGNRFDGRRRAEAIRALYATGFFRDVELRYEGGLLTVAIEERPVIESLDEVKQYLTGLYFFTRQKMAGAARSAPLQPRGDTQIPAGNLSQFRRRPGTISILDRQCLLTFIFIRRYICEFSYACPRS